METGRADASLAPSPIVTILFAHSFSAATGTVC
jgi:hypothetical protein